MTNRYGVDVPYFKKELATLIRSLPDRTPDELQRYLSSLAITAAPMSVDQAIAIVEKAPLDYFTPRDSHIEHDAFEVVKAAALSRPSSSKSGCHRLHKPDHKSDELKLARLELLVKGARSRFDSDPVMAKKHLDAAIKIFAIRE